MTIEPDWMHAERLEAFRVDEEPPATNGHAPTHAGGITPELLRSELLDADALAALPAPRWLVDGVLVRDSLALLYGKRSTLKSTIALDLALSLATGAWWFGHELEAGPALYCIAEGRGGIGQRIDAWKQHRMIYQAPGFVGLPRTVSLLDHQAVAALSTVAGELHPVVIVVDTLSRSMPGGDENGKDMSRAVESADELRRATGACVLLVHHDNREGSNPRGHSSLDGGVDTIIEATRDDTTITLHNHKQKDFAEFPKIKLTALEHAGSIVVTTHKPGGDELNETALTLLRVLADIAGPEGVATSVWLRSCQVAERSFYRWQKRLTERGFTATEKPGRGARYSLTDLGAQALDES